MASALRISVLITTYNYRHFVAEAIDSVLVQSQAADEILVLDDGSSDGTAEFVRDRYRDESRVQVHRRDNQGQLATFAHGVRLASGEIIAFLDADDRWLPDYLARVRAVYDARPQIDFVYTNMRLFGEREGLFLRDAQSREFGLSILLGAYATRWQGSATSALSLRRALATAVLDVPESHFPQWKTRADDWVVCGSDILGGRKYYLAEPLVEYRAHGTNAWLQQERDPEVSLRHWLRVETMLAHYRQRAGLPPESKAELLRHVKYEFLTRPQPSRKELQSYCRLIDDSSLPWMKRLERKLSMWRHYWRTR